MSRDSVVPASLQTLTRGTAPGPVPEPWRRLHYAPGPGSRPMPEVSRRWRIRYPASAGHPKRRSAPVERRR